ncbi:VOC family protein [Subtercola endophyticus]|uniref:VOC family protein n=1 Tax=Subtercola endophyticus TaxID=2895559 RepID=UPI001E4220F5|nr:VOC family protein [Subtercola endophyticus]UFS58354.1 VOC family protein [Subtercola endophyticus]
MNLVSIRLITDNVAALVAFYERALQTTATWSTDDFAEVRTTTGTEGGVASGTLAIGSTRTVGLFGPGAARPADNHTAIIEFLVDDVDALYEQLRVWVSDVVTVPTTMPWGNRSLLVRDPDGTLVNFFTPVSPEAVAKFAVQR